MKIFLAYTHAHFAKSIFFKILHQHNIRQSMLLFDCLWCGFYYIHINMYMSRTNCHRCNSFFEIIFHRDKNRGLLHFLATCLQQYSLILFPLSLLPLFDHHLCLLFFHFNLFHEFLRSQNTAIRNSTTSWSGL